MEEKAKVDKIEEIKPEQLQKLCEAGFTDVEMAHFFGNKSNSINDSYVKISVIDNGVGIPPKDLPYVFDRFSQSKTDRKKPLG